MPPVILFKLDDIVQHPDAAIHPKWHRITDYLEKGRIKAAMGIICDSLETQNPAYIRWIQEHHTKGVIEFWNHGYHSRTMQDKTGEFEVGTAADQQSILEKCEKLAQEKLGFGLPAFGPHWSGTTQATDQALAAVREITIWLCGPTRPLHFKGLSIPRVVSLEDPIFVPDFAKFQAAYEHAGYKEPVLVLQGHPVAWSEGGWKGFVKIAEFLVSRQSTFMTPSEYWASVRGQSGPN